MHELDDIALLREFARCGSEPAFAELVMRHVNKVYSVALRHTRNPHSAEEITQAVFVILARKAGTLGKNNDLRKHDSEKLKQALNQVGFELISTNQPIELLVVEKVK